MLKILLFLFFPLSLYSYQYQLSICAIFQDEAPYLKEWIDYHRKIGVEHFYLYNNNSSDDYFTILSPYIENEIVELIQWSSEDNTFHNFCYVTQIGAYNDAINKSKGITKWLAIIDIDEYLLPVCEDSMVKILEKHFKKEVGVYLNWQMFGTSYIEKIKDNELMIEKLIYKLNYNDPTCLWGKSIVRVDYVDKCTDPHFCTYLHGKQHVNTKRQKISYQNNDVYLDIARINHYWTKDEWFLYNIKIPRQQQWCKNIEEPESVANRIFLAAEKMNQEIDLEIYRFLPLN